MGMAMLIAGLVIFIAVHLFVTRRGERDALIGWIGIAPYKIAFSLISAAGLLLIIFGFGAYRATGWVVVWDPPVWARHLAIPLMWLAFIALVAAYIPGNIKRVLKHPMLVGVKLWALAHLLANGDLGSMLLFGSLLAWAVYDRISLKYRTDAGGPPIPAGGVKNDVVAVVVGSILFAAFGYVFHPLWIGVPVFGTS
ncbi:MAG TPA: NnrU family protein [Xanthobacteraceae bacterium]|nr:NnrU family protein [Xanthobacteraceae bacterium]